MDGWLGEYMDAYMANGWMVIPTHTSLMNNGLETFIEMAVVESMSVRTVTMVMLVHFFMSFHIRP